MSATTLPQKFTENEKYWMKVALEQAQLALVKNEVPVGCVFVEPSKNKMIAKGHNQTMLYKNGIEHAEIVCIRKMEKEKLLVDNTHTTPPPPIHLYVTVEPCIMCIGALIEIMPCGKIYYGASNERFGGCGSVIDAIHNRSLYPNINQDQPLIECVSGLFQNEAIQLLSEFFAQTNLTCPQHKRIDKSGRIKSL